MEEQRVSLSNISSGAAVERFDLELQRVLANVQDPNTGARVKRTITLKMIIHPQDDDRELGKVTVSCESKLAPIEPFATHVYMGLDHGQGVATEANPRQHELIPREKPELKDVKYKVVGD